MLTDPFIYISFESPPPPHPTSHPHSFSCSRGCQQLHPQGTDPFFMAEPTQSSSGRGIVKTPLHHCIHKGLLETQKALKAHGEDEVSQSLNGTRILQICCLCRCCSRSSELPEQKVPVASPSQGASFFSGSGPLNLRFSHYQLPEEFKGFARGPHLRYPCLFPRA